MSGRSGSRPHPWPHPWPVLATATLLLVLLTCLAPVNAYSEGVSSDERPLSPGVAQGERLYRIHCLNCHGPEGRGAGPMAAVLKTELPDLTLLAAHNDGDFPVDRVYQSIDGRFRVRGHGLREMPVWGLSFQERGLPGDQEHEVQQRLRALVAYLEAIQRQE